MNDIRFASGSDITVSADGEVLGGVISAVCSVENSAVKIEEFLTDVPVAQLPSVKHMLILQLNVLPGSKAAKRFAPERVELADKHKRVIYTGCRVEKMTCEIQPRQRLEYVFRISASERSVEDV